MLSVEVVLEYHPFDSNLICLGGCFLFYHTMDIGLRNVLTTEEQVCTKYARLHILFSVKRYLLTSGNRF
jgi:hypothetical protein